jgi:hypothetical protein
MYDARRIEPLEARTAIYNATSQYCVLGTPMDPCPLDILQTAVHLDRRRRITVGAIRFSWLADHHCNAAVIHRLAHPATSSKRPGPTTGCHTGRQRSLCTAVENSKDALHEPPMMTLPAACISKRLQQLTSWKAVLQPPHFFPP